MSVDLLSALDRSLTYLAQVVRGITDEQRGAPTPCPEFDVTALVGHVVSATSWFAEMPERGAADPGALTAVELTGSALHAAFVEAADRARANWHASDLPRSFQTPFAELTGEQLTSFMIMELVGHGLDLALATGQPGRPDDDLATLAFQITAGMGESNLRVPKMMGPAVTVPDGAPVIDRFLGLIGRDPAWTA